MIRQKSHFKQPRFKSQNRGPAGTHTTSRGATEPAVTSRRLRRVAVVGLDGAGLTLASEFCRIGSKVIGLDCDPKKAQMAEFEICSERFIASDDFSAARSADMIVLCVDKDDHSGTRAELLRVTERLALHIERGQVIVVEGASEEDPVCAEVRSVLERGSGFEDQRDFKLSFAPSNNEASNPAARVAAIALLHHLSSIAPTRVGLEELQREFESDVRHDTVEPLRVLPRRMDRDLADGLLNSAFVCDLIVIVYGLLCGFWLRFRTGIREIGIPSEPNLRDYAVYILFGLLSLFLTLCFYQLYERRILLRLRHVYGRILKAGITWLVIFVSLPLLFEFRPPISRFFVLIAALLTITALIIWRSCFHLYLRKSSFLANLQQRVLFVGWNEEARRLARTFSTDRSSAYVVTGWVKTPTTAPEELSEQLGRCLGGSIEDIDSILRCEGVDIAILADSEMPQRDVLRLYRICEQEHVAFKMIPSYFRILVSGLHLETMSAIPILGVSRLPLDQFFNALIKRIVDLIGAAIGLTLSAPLIAFFGFSVYLESPGPVIYRQRRLGRNGTSFYMLKIRSMHLCAEEQGTIGWTIQDDPRRLKIGAFMRRWNIDELPQFWNVLKAEMSLVGPRPERPELVANFKCDIPHYQARHNIKPGMTGWAQVKGLRGDTDLRERIVCDLFYLEKWSFLLDLQIMIMTFFSGKKGC